VFDLIFIDADKKNNETYYNLTIDKLRSGGLIIVDNVLWSGKVIGEKKTDSATTSISDFNEMIHSDQRVEKLILPVRDGVYIIRKK
jgi:predicted O-methyltransferase YrrM